METPRSRSREVSFEGDGDNLRHDAQGAAIASDTGQRAVTGSRTLLAGEGEMATSLVQEVEKKSDVSVRKHTP